MTTDSQGQAVFDVPFTPPADLPVVTATATDPQGNTSEVSALRRASLQAPTQTVRAGSRSAADLLGRGRAMASPSRTRMPGRSTRQWDLTLSVAAGTLTLSSDRRPDRLGRWDRDAALQGALSAVERGAGGLELHAAAGVPRQHHAEPGRRVGRRRRRSSPSSSSRTVVFLVTTTADSGPGSLRQAILDSNAADRRHEHDRLRHPGPGVQTIAPASPLPAITNPVLIDGSSQPGYAGTPLIAIDTSASGMADGLTITGSDVTVRGLAIDGFALGNGSVADDLTIQSGLFQASDSGTAGRADTYRIDTSGDGRLVAQLQAQGITTRLSLLDAQGQVLVQSDGLSPANPDDADRPAPARPGPTSSRCRARAARGTMP